MIYTLGLGLDCFDSPWMAWFSLAGVFTFIFYSTFSGKVLGALFSSSLTVLTYKV